MLAVFSLAAIGPALAGSKGRQNTAVGLTAATVYSVLTKNDRAALVGAVASAAAWKSYEDARKRESRQRSYSVAGYRSTYTPSRSYSSGGYARPASYKRTYYKPATSPVHDLQRQLAAMQHQAKVNQLYADNKALREQVSQQNMLIAGVQSDMTKSRTTNLIMMVVAILALGVGAAGRLPWHITRRNG